jgi:tagatose-1,6-bisphosphate aldolase non-catalytic subunit AgaZ/GatZ
MFQGRLAAEYYSGDKTELWLQRHFSYSDRIRHYWPDAEAIAAVEALRAPEWQGHSRTGALAIFARRAARNRNTHQL